jgi:hypothetical protein
LAVGLKRRSEPSTPRGWRSDRSELETDYLVVGAGASGMAFVDSLLTNPMST